jgi:hypothetical protein
VGVGPIVAAQNRPLALALALALALELELELTLTLALALALELMTALSPCSSCHRHVRRAERTCPFCGASIAFDVAPTMRVVSERLGRAAIFSIGAAAVSSVAGCGARTDLLDPVEIAVDAATPSDAQPMRHDTGTIASAYGGPAFRHDAGAPSTHYGGPPHDAAFAEDAGATFVLYGGPEITPDAGDVDMGCSNADYGAPPCR